MKQCSIYKGKRLVGSPGWCLSLKTIFIFVELQTDDLEADDPVRYRSVCFDERSNFDFTLFWPRSMKLISGVDELGKNQQKLHASSVRRKTSRDSLTIVSDFISYNSVCSGSLDSLMTSWRQFLRLQFEDVSHMFSVLRHAMTIITERGFFVSVDYRPFFRATDQVMPLSTRCS
jgi:hypothetical protein